MSKEISVIDHHVPEGSPLENSEWELSEAVANSFEDFYRQGVILDKIRTEKEYKLAHYESFDEYCNDRQPCGIKAAHAYRLIKAKNVRHLLPTFSDNNSPIGEKPLWTEGAMRPLLHKDFKPSDQKRLGRKIATRVKKGDKLTAKLVKEVCDADRGVEKKNRSKAQRAIAKADTPAETIQSMKVDVDLWLSSLGEVPGEFWEDAEKDDPGCVKRLIGALSNLASFLRS